VPHLRFGVLGAAKIARKYTLAAMQMVPGVEFAAIAARDPARAEEVATEFGGAAVLADYEEVIASPDLDAVYIPLPNALHHEWTVRAIEAGKHVLVEKSLAADYLQCRDIVDRARARGTVIVENFMCERHPQNVEARRLIADGELGDVHSLELSFGFPPFPREDQRNSAELSGGALNDAGAYCLDMAAYYLGESPREVTAISTRQDYDVDVIGAAMLTFSEGRVAHAGYGFTYDYRNDVRIWGSTGQVVIDRSFSIPPDREPSVTLIRNTVAERLPLPSADQFQLQLEHFLRLVEMGGDSELDKIAAHAATMEAVRVSAAEGRTVPIAEVVG